MPQKTINELDNCVKELSKYSNGKVNRNILIEMAVNKVLEVAPEIINEYNSQFDNSNDDFYDTIICPAQDGGQYFLKNFNCWQYVKIDAKKLDNLKYMCLYVGYPHSKLMYWCKIKHFEDEIVDNKKKYRIIIEGPLHKIDVPLGDANSFIMRSAKYTTLAKIKNANTLEDLF